MESCDVSILLPPPPPCRALQDAQVLFPSVFIYLFPPPPPPPPPLCFMASILLSFPFFLTTSCLLLFWLSCCTLLLLEDSIKRTSTKPKERRMDGWLKGGTDHNRTFSSISSSSFIYPPWSSAAIEYARISHPIFGRRRRRCCCWEKKKKKRTRNWYVRHHTHTELTRYEWRASREEKDDTTRRDKKEEEERTRSFLNSSIA